MFKYLKRFLINLISKDLKDKLEKLNEDLEFIKQGIIDIDEHHMVDKFVEYATEYKDWKFESIDHSISQMEDDIRNLTNNLNSTIESTILSDKIIQKIIDEVNKRQLIK